MSVSMLTISPDFKLERFTSLNVVGISSTENILLFIEATVRLTPFIAIEPLYITYFVTSFGSLKKYSF